MANPPADGTGFEPDDVFVASDDVLQSEVDDETVLLDPESGTYYGLNGVGSLLWERLQEPQTVEELETELRETFDVSPEQCRNDVRTFLEALRESGLVTQPP